MNATLVWIVLPEHDTLTIKKNYKGILHDIGRPNLAIRGIGPLQSQNMQLRSKSRYSSLHIMPLPVTQMSHVLLFLVSVADALLYVWT